MYFLCFTLNHQVRYTLPFLIPSASRFCISFLLVLNFFDSFAPNCFPSFFFHLAFLPLVHCCLGIFRRHNYSSQTLADHQQQEEPFSHPYHIQFFSSSPSSFFPPFLVSPCTSSTTPSSCILFSSCASCGFLHFTYFSFFLFLFVLLLHLSFFLAPSPRPLAGDCLHHIFHLF